MTVSKWERGTATPGPYHVQQLKGLDRARKRAKPEQHARVEELLGAGLAVAAAALLIGIGFAVLGGGDD